VLAVGIAYSNKGEDYDSSSIDTERISQTRQASSEEADKVSHNEGVGDL
jgi:hypothetical protein